MHTDWDMELTGFSMGFRCWIYRSLYGFYIEIVIFLVLNGVFLEEILVNIRMFSDAGIKCGNMILGDIEGN